MEQTNKEEAVEITPGSESNKESLYSEILHTEARSLLAKYLPEALPQEPTEILSDIIPQYLGKFKGKHYITAETVFISHAQQKRMDEIFRRQQEGMKRFEEETKEWLRLLEENASKGIYDEDLESKVFSSEEPEPETQLQKEDWEEPEKLLKGRGQYSVDTWRGIYVLVHELIHQKQAELNPEAFPQLSSPELNSIDPDNTPTGELKRELTKAHKVHSRTMDDNSLFYPVIEGMGVVGSFYVMGRLLVDLKQEGQSDIAEKVKQVRDKTIQIELGETQGRAEYDLNYIEGVRMMRKIYKHFGIENTPKLLTQIDLQACHGITKGSPQYQQITENPALLLGLQRTV